MQQSLAPSSIARDLTTGAYDIHVHIAPDVMERRIDDLSLARRFQSLGLAGFVVKSHYLPTGERAAVVNQATGASQAIGAITLNHSVGGLNPVAVELAARSGCRFVWLPTVDSVNERNCAGELLPGATPPMWMALQQDLEANGIRPAPIDVLDEAGDPTDEVVAVLQVVAKHDLTLATGHLSAAEILRIVPAARELGVRRTVVTHPEFTSQRMAPSDQRALLGHGDVLLERCLTTPLTGKIPWDTWFSNIRQVGVEHSVVSSDLGQPFNPPVEDGLALAADRLLGAGFSEDEVRLMTAVNSSRAVGAQ